MAIYRYALKNSAGPNEHLGFIEIPNDDEAIAFGREVIADLMRPTDPVQEDISLEITEGARQIDSVSLAVAKKHHKNFV